MASPTVTIRVPAALLEAIDKRAERAGRSRSEEMLATLGERYLGADSEPAPAPRSAPRAPAPPAQVTRASELPAVVSDRGVNMRAAMERAGIAEFDPSQKRPTYQKGQVGQGKAKRR
jgi:hypothetical protein